MKHARKMILIDYNDVENRVNDNDGDGENSLANDDTIMKTLRKQMNRVLKNRSLNNQQKILLYNQMLRRHTHVKNESLKAKKDLVERLLDFAMKEKNSSALTKLQNRNHFETLVNNNNNNNNDDNALLPPQSTRSLNLPSSSSVLSQKSSSSKGNKKNKKMHVRKLDFANHTFDDDDVAQYETQFDTKNHHLPRSAKSRAFETLRRGFSSQKKKKKSAKSVSQHQSGHGIIKNWKFLE